MYAKSTRTEREARRSKISERAARRSSITERDDRIARPTRAQTCELRAKRAMRMCPRSGQIFLFVFTEILNSFFKNQNEIYASYQKMYG